MSAADRRRPALLAAVAVVAAVLAALALLRGCEEESPGRASDPAVAAPSHTPSGSSGGRLERRRVTPSERVRREGVSSASETSLGAESPGARRSDRMDVSCVVVDGGGTPVPDAEVALEVDFVLPDDAVAAETVRAEPGGDVGTSGWASGGEGGETGQVLRRRARTDAEGRVTVPVARAGRAWLTVRATGYRLAVHDLGWVDLSRSGARIVLEDAPEEARTRLLVAGEPLGRCELQAFYMEAGDAQIHVRERVGEDGWVSSAWLTPGRTYSISFHAPGAAAPTHDGRRLGGVVVWPEGDTLELARSPAEARAAKDAGWALRRRLTAERRARHPAREPPPVE